MNHIYRVVWNAATSTWTAVAETARGRCKSKRVRRAAVLLAAASLAPTAFAQTVSVAAGSGNTNAYVSGNGTTVVNINTANAAGLSHNRYNQFNVNQQGLVLNNTNSSQISYQSQLAGQVTANFNMTNAAKVILNEVVSNNRSTLAGFTEVLGGRADVILANPYGITCSGCGFINTDRVTLTTGVPYLNGNGSLGGFTVNQGDILVTGNGLNATAQQMLDLVARSIKLEGTVNAQDLSITAGANRYDYASRSVTGNVPGAGTTPAFAIDSSALGGMYANRIRLTATEAGVGVRMLGDAAATADDFMLTSAGSIQLQGHVSAQRDVLVASTNNDAAAIALANGTLTSGRNTALTASQGGVNLNGGAIVAAADLAVNAASLIDTASSATIDNNNVRSAGGTLGLAIAGAASANGTRWSASGNWQGQFGSLATSAGTRFQSGSGLTATSTAGNLDLGAAALQASGDLLLTSAGKITTAAGNGQGVQSLNGNLSVTATQGLDNAGAMTADKGASTLRVDGTIVNSGTIHAATTLDVADHGGNGTASVTNSGNLISDGALALRATDVTNTSSGWVQATTGSQISAASLNNAGAMLLSQQATAQDTVTTTGTLTNSGTIQSKGNAAISSQDLVNQRTLLADGNLDVSAGGNVSNAANAIMQAGNTLAVDATGRIDNAAQGTMRADTVQLSATQGLGNDGLISADAGATTLRVGGTLANTGGIQASTALDIADRQGTATEAVDNTGYMLSGGTVALKADAVTNAPNGTDPQSGWIQAATGSTVSARTLDNQGTWLLSQQAGSHDTVTTSGTLTNSGTLQTLGSATVNAHDVTNSGALAAAGNLGVTATTDFDNQAGGIAQAGQALTIGAGGQIDNAANALVKAASVGLTAAQGLSNAGIVTADTGGATLRVDGTLTNTGTLNAGGALDIADRQGNGTENVVNNGYMIAGGALNLKATTVNNTAAPSDASSGWIQSNGSTVSAQNLTNSGTWLLSMQNGAGASVTLTGTLTNNGTMQAQQDATLTAARLVNQANAVLRAGRDLVTNVGTGNAFTNAGTMQAGGRLGVIGAGAQLSNASTGKLLGDRLDLQAASVDNAGVIQGGTSTLSAITLTGTFLNESGAVATLATTAGGNGTVSAGTITNNGTLQSVGAMSLAVGTGGLGGAGDYLTGGNLSVGSNGGNVYAATINGTMQAGDQLSVQDGGNGSTLTVAAGKTVSGNTVDIDMGSVTLGNTAVLTSTGNMNVDVNTLTLTGNTTSTARVLAAMGHTGTGTINVRNTLNNTGLLFSGNDLKVTAPNISNTGTGGIAALHDLTIAANSGALDLTAATPAGNAGNLTNDGAIYAGNSLSVQANGTLTNNSTINAGSAMALRANTLVNHRDIVSDGTIDIVAATMRNEVVGGDTRTWNSGTHSNPVTVGGGYDDNDKGGNLDEFQDYKVTWTDSQSYSGGTPTYSPQILASTNLKLTFHTGTNLGGTIWGGNSITMQGFSADGSQGDPNRFKSMGIWDDMNHGFQLGGNATFVNDNLALQQKDYTRNYTLHTKYVALGPAKNYSNELCDSSHDDEGCHYRNGYNDTFAFSENNVLKSGVYTKTLTGSGFSLTNNGSVTSNVNDAVAGANKPQNVTTKAPDSQSVNNGTQLTGSTGTVGTTNGKGAVTGNGATLANGVSFVAGNAANGVNGTSFGGINIPLPTNPNGFFVVAREPGARYLVESNPLYMSGSATYGSDYLTRMLGYSTDQIGLLLGDASYENYLVRQQLISQTGNVLLASYQNGDSQMQGLMNSAVAESKSLGLEYGKALTPDQQANLKQDIVWMVQTVVDGKTVLAPVVYLSQSTKQSIAGGGVISAQDANLALTSLTNNGGTIVGGKSLVVTTTGDITNVSGTIKGGDVSLTSTEGNIVNKTFSTGNGTDKFYTTTVGKTGTIESTGSLALDAKKDITNLGANMNAGTDASLKAGGNVTFDTIENKNTNTVYTPFHADGGSGLTGTTTTTTQQVKSGLNVGGNLAVKAGSDVTLAGTDAKVGGNADLNAGGNVNIVARENTTTTHSESQASGFGMNNSLYGSTTVTTDSTSVRNVGSTLQVGGNANVTAGKDITIQGSNVDVKGNGQLNATNVNVLAGRNYDETHTTTEKTGVMQVSSGSSGSAGAGASAQASSGNNQAAASAGASAQAAGTGAAGLAFSSTTTTQTDTTDLRHVGSNVNIGGNATINATNDVTLQGSNVKAGGNATVNAQNVNVLAAEDKKTSSTTTTSTSVGLMASSANEAGAKAEAGASAFAGKGNPNAAANASAEASASTENHLDLVQHTKTTNESLDTTHQGSGISAGGDLNIKASNNLTVEGSQLASGGNMNLDAKDMSFKAVNDVHETRSSSDTTTAGFYASGNAKASADAGAAVGIGAQAGASAEASAHGEVGLYGSNTRTSNVDGSTTAVTSGISAGGNITRTATNSINDVGTQISAGGNLTQSAQTITSQAAANTTYGSSSSQTDTAKLGAYAEASAEASASAAAGPGAGKPAKTEASAGAGITASYQHDDATGQYNTSNAVVSNIKVGGNVNSTSTGATTLEGTTITAGKDVALNAGSLDYQAAKSTSSSSSNSTSAGGSVSVDLVNKSGSVGVNYAGDKGSDSSSTAVVGGINAGGNLSVNTKGDTRLEGTNLAAGGSASVTTGGNLTVDAAKNTSSSSSQSVAVDVGVTAGKGEGSAEVGVGVGTSSASRNQDVAGSISSGSGPLTIKSGGNATFTGTSLSSGGDASVAAGGNLTFNAARDKQSSQSVDVGVSAAASGGKKENVGGTKAAGSNKKTGGQTMDTRSGEASVDVGYASSNSNTASGASISSGGNISLSSGKNTTLEGTQANAAGKVGVAAGGTVTQKAAVSTSSSTAVDVSASGAGSSMTPEKKTGTGATKTGTGTGGTGKVTKGPAAPQQKGSGVANVAVDIQNDSSSQATKLSGGQGVTITEGKR